MHHTQKNIPGCVVLLLDISFHSLGEWCVSGFVTLHDFATLFVDYDDMVVFKNDLHLTCSCRRLPESPDLKHSLRGDRKSTRLNSSHANISYAVFCLKKKKYIILHYII